MDNNNELQGGTISLQLNKLNNVEVVEYKGKKSIIIPVEDNGIYISDKGTIIISFFMSKMFEEKWGKTHSLKRKLTGAEFKSMSKEQRDKTPIVGYFEPYKPRENGAQQQTTTKTQNSQYQSQQTIKPNNEFAVENNSRVDDLPF